MAKLNFQHHYSKSSLSHDPSEIILICRFAAQKELILLSMLKAVVLIHMLWKL